MKNIKRYGRIIIPAVLIIACVSVLLLNVISEAEPSDTYHSGWTQIKDSASEDGATFAATLALDTNEGVFASIPDDAYHIQSMRISGNSSMRFSEGEYWQFAFYGTDADDETFSFTLTGWARGNGFAQVICEGDGILGSQDVVTEPNGDAITNGFWADTITLDETTKWPYVAVKNSGDNEVAVIEVDITGLEYISFVTYDVNGGAEAASIGVYGRQY